MNEDHVITHTPKSKLLASPYAKCYLSEGLSLWLISLAVQTCRWISAEWAQLRCIIR